MKKTLLNTLTFVSLFFASTANAQVGVGVPAGDIHPSAELEVKSTEKGLLLPRMTKVQRIAIGSPATGLIVYQIDGDVPNPAGLYYFDGLIWKNGIGAQGVQGTAGAAGPQGPAGANGTNGVQGVAGPIGVPGPTGIPGEQGPKGDKGDVGATGAKGAAGSTGETGATGPAGKDGKVEFQNFKVSTTGDTLYLTNGNYVIIPGISLSNPPTSGFGPAIVDIDGNNYKTVYIGKQHWMAENLKVSRFNDGTTIPNVTDISTWSNLTAAAWAYYNDEVTNVKYGKLYNWYTARGESNFQPFNITKKNVCPSGWHVPSNDEWGVLTSYLGGDELAGGKLKEEGATNWVSPNNNATNSTLFTGLPGGIRGDNGFYFRFGEYGFWWTSTENVNSTNNAWSRVLYNMDESAVNFSFDKNHGFSVRCLKN